MAMATARTRYENGYVQYLWAGEVAHYCTVPIVATIVVVEVRTTSSRVGSHFMYSR